MTAPELIHGHGTNACPTGSFCLYRDVNFNNATDPATGDDKILVIPEGQYIDDFSTYGFDHSDDGVSSVVNYTTQDNTLFSAPSQAGQTLPVAARQTIADMTRMPMAGSPTGTWNDQAQSALAAPKPSNLTITQQYAGSWADTWPSTKWIYSYHLVMHAANTDVHQWSVGFGDLPEGTVLAPQFVTTFWGKIVKDGSDGSVLLESPDGGTHIVPAGGELPIDIQVLYPGQNTSYETLNSLNAQQLG